MKKLKYPLVILLQSLSTLAPIVSGVYMAYKYMLKDGKVLFSIGEMEFTFPVLIFFICMFQALVLRIPLKKLYNQAVLENEYDEFGNSKKKSFENLTRKEREAMDTQKAYQMENLLSSSELKKIIHTGSKNPEKDLNSLIGITTVKNKVTEMTARMKFEKEAHRKSKDKSSMSGRHFCFYGSAGTGKTTVARIITGFLYKYGYIKENKCVEIVGSFLKAGEDSGTKTKMIIQKAYGGVLFIDEAYTIMDGSGAYGREAIGTLIKEMEDNRDRLIIILAGYKPDMKRLLDANEGFKSRIKEYLEFPDYTTEEMKEIFTAMAHSEGFVVSGDAINNFEVRVDKERKLSSFGNARTARNILDESIDRHALNYGNGTLTASEGVEPDTEENKRLRFMLCGCDVSTAVNKAVL